MRLLNHNFREFGFVLSNEFIFQCPKCQAFAIGITRPFIDLKKFCRYHQKAKCSIRPSPVFYIL